MMSYFPVMSENTRGYKDLFVWRYSIDLVPLIYRITKSFPSDELFGITSQLRRAIVSVPSNIAEGQGRAHHKEFIHFLSIALGSLAEVDTLLIIAGKLGFINQSQLQEIENKILSIRKSLQKLIQSQPMRFGPGPRPPAPGPRRP
jgi:four helix bundle protein